MKAPWVKRIQLFLNEGPCPTHRGRQLLNSRKTLTTLKNNFSETTPPNSTRLGQKKTSLGKLRGFKVVQMKGNALTQREIIAK